MRFLLKLKSNYFGNIKRYQKKLLKKTGKNYVDTHVIQKKLKGRNLYVLLKREQTIGQSQFLEKLDPKNIIFIDERMPNENDVFISFGYGSFKQNIELVSKYPKNEIYFIEAAFLRSILMDRSNSKFDLARCFFIDDIGHHYDPKIPSRLELLLNDKNLVLSKQQLEKSKRLIKKIVDNKLTKYNHQSIKEITIGRKDRPKVLVVEQAKNDFAIIQSDGNNESFESMLRTAIDQNPDADILVKIHPDTLEGKRGGIKESYYGSLENKNLFLIDESINPFSLINICEKVYVFTSMLGFEALLANKEVHVFGIPSYANWGCTIDYQKLPRRKNTRTVEELFYIIYVMYTTYRIDNSKNSDVEEVIDYLLNLRREYFEGLKFENEQK